MLVYVNTCVKKISIYCKQVDLFIRLAKKKKMANMNW